MSEEWRDVIGFEGLYKVSSHGRVLRVDSNQIRKAVPLDSGYLHLQLYKHSKFHGKYIHILVLEAFKGPRPEGLEGMHLDDNKANCYLDNLDWGTTSQNRQDGLRNGTNTQTRLTPEQVRYLRSLPRGVHQGLQQLAIAWGISEVTLHNAKSGKTYKHVEEIINA